MRDRDKATANDGKLDLWRAAECHCIVCGCRLDPHLFDLGHRIKKSKSMRDTYGDRVIFHPLNMLPVCHGSRAGKSCNDACSLGSQTLPGRELLQRIIRVTTGVEPEPNMRAEYRALREEFEEERG